MLIFRSKKPVVGQLYFRVQKFCSGYKFPRREDDYTDVPNYPPIFDPSRDAVRRRKEEEFYQYIHRQKTVEEKLFAINMPRYYGWKCLMLKEGELPYNSLAFTQYLTRTHVISSNELPEQYNENKELAVKISQEIKSSVEEEIGYQLALPKRQKYESEIQLENYNTDVVIKGINRIILRELYGRIPHLSRTEIDFSPRIEAFWTIGGLDPPDNVIERRKKEIRDVTEEETIAPIDRWVQYFGAPIIQLRHSTPLPNVWDENFTGPVPVWTHEPKYLGFKDDHRHGTSIPGFWPGDQRTFPILSYHRCNHVKYRPPSYGEEDHKEAPISQAILASFGWLVPLAAYRGFTPFTDLTYPTVAQAVVTDGRKFIFSIYQMNTYKLYCEFATENPKTNICWVSSPENLYDCIENGKVKGLNEDTLAKLVLLYLNEPKERSGVDLQPYLDKDIPFVANYEDEEKRCWLEQHFKHFSSNRPIHRTDLMYEVYEWEKIYKIEHQTMPLEARKRPFEQKDEHPYRRKMSDHTPEYIPKHKRPDKDIPLWRQRRFKKTFYPE